MKTIIDLNGQWDFVVDLDPKYHRDPRIYPTPPYANPQSSRRHWQKVPVPGVWQKYGERYDLFEGVGWFAREFELADLPDGAAARLCFGAVNYLCRVFVNGIEAGAHEGGYTGFSLDVGSLVKPGHNHLAVMVDNRAATIKWPPVLGYFNYGGIHRSVTLEIVSGPALATLQVEAAPDPLGGWLRLECTVQNPRDGLRITVECSNASTSEPVPPDGHFITELWASDVQPWSPQAPNLYAVEVTLYDEEDALADEILLNIGFRSLDLQAGRIRLNGQPLPLKGICYVFDSPTHGLVMTGEQIETDAALMKAAGCNAVRCHYPMDPIFYETCDRLGLLVWIEIPVYCYHPGDTETGTAFANPQWLALAQQTAGEMIAAARSHPSVAVYSIGNECNTQNPEAAPFFQQLAAAVRAADATRLLSYAALYGIIGSTAGLVDVLGINSYWGWYNRDLDFAEPTYSSLDNPTAAQVTVEPIDLAPLRSMLDEILARQPHQALMLTEFGADSVPGYYARSGELWSEDYHARLLHEILKLAEDYPQIVGTFPFCFSDYRDPSKVPNGYWNELNLKGIVTYQRRKKQAFAVLQEYYDQNTLIIQT